MGVADETAYKERNGEYAAAYAEENGFILEAVYCDIALR